MPSQDYLFVFSNIFGALKLRAIVPAYVGKPLALKLFGNRMRFGNPEEMPYRKAVETACIAQNVNTWEELLLHDSGYVLEDRNLNVLASVPYFPRFYPKPYRLLYDAIINAVTAAYTLPLPDPHTLAIRIVGIIPKDDIKDLIQPGQILVYEEVAVPLSLLNVPIYLGFDDLTQHLLHQVGAFSIEDTFTRLEYGQSILAFLPYIGTRTSSPTEAENIIKNMTVLRVSRIG